MEFYAKIRVPPQALYDTLWTAFYGGGINSWGAIEHRDSLRASGVSAEARREKLLDLARYHDICQNAGRITAAILPMCAQQWVLIHEEGEEDSRILCPEGLQKGLDVLAEKHPGVLGRIIDEQADAWDASTLVECCLFGEIKYC